MCIRDRFWTAVGDPAVAGLERFATNADRRACRAEIVEHIAAILRQQPRSNWLALFAQARVPAGPIYRVDEVGADPVLRDAGFVYRTETAAGAIPQVGLGIRFDGRTEGNALPPPRLGEHNVQILSLIHI